MLKRFSLAALAVIASGSASLAHHPLAGMPMTSFSDGLLSGVGHPLLGFDHLFFVIAMGIAAAYTGYARSAPLAYIVAMVVGCLAMSFGVGLPLKETMIALSLLILGAVVVSGRALSLPMAVLLFTGFGLFHGSAFGDSLVEQEAALGSQVLIGYLIGLAALQYAIAIAAGWFVKTVLGSANASAVNARLAGAVVAGIGVFLTLETLEGAAFAALGIAG